VVECDWSPVEAALSQGLLPVVHGDCFLDQEHGCTVVGGDKLLRHLASHTRPQLCCFVTDVCGVYDKPPKASTAATESPPRLLHELIVDQQGNLVSTYAAGEALPQDVTGGIAEKVHAAAAVAAEVCPVFVCGAGTAAAREVMACDATSAIEGCTWVRGASLADPDRLWPPVGSGTADFLQFMTNPQATNPKPSAECQDTEGD